MPEQATGDKALLTTPKAERGDTGKYTIKLKNASGTAEGSIDVTVLGELTLTYIEYAQTAPTIK